MIYISILLLIISAISKSICDISESCFSTSKLSSLNPNFWNKHASAGNKWKNGDKSQGEKFLFSSTILVFLTDAWHLFDVIRDLSLIAAIILTNNIWLLIAIYPVRQLLFQITYSYLTKK